jgi:prophage regulatory protein
MNFRYLRRAEVLNLRACSYSTLYRDIKAGRFPAPYRLGSNSVRWRSDEVEAWLANRPKSGLLVNKVEGGA